MTEPSPADDDRSEVPLLGPETADGTSMLDPAVDGLVLIALNDVNDNVDDDDVDDGGSGSGRGDVVLYANSGLRRLIGGPRSHGDLTGRRASELFDPTSQVDWKRARGRFDPSMSPAPGQPESTTAIVGLRTGDDSSVLTVHATFTVLNPSPESALMLIQFRDPTSPGTDRLAADRASVVRFLNRGGGFGDLCRQIADRIDDALLGAATAIGVGAVDGSTPCRTVVPGDVGATAFESVGRHLLSAANLLPRVVNLDSLTPDLADPYRHSGHRHLWSVPVFVGPDLGGVLLVAAPGEPDGRAAGLLEHYVEVLRTALDHVRSRGDDGHDLLHDALTHLPNRALIVDQLHGHLAGLGRSGGRTLLVLLVDIDRFRTLNDSRGAAAGDRVLVEVARRLGDAVGPGDIVGRLSNDQYLIARHGDRDRAQAEAAAGELARQLRSALDKPIQLDDGEHLRITASVGFVVVDEPLPGAVAVISRAEAALAQATARGRGQIAMFEPQHRSSALERLELEQALPHALQSDELVVHYQPIVETRTGFMVGAEALIRWQRPGHGLIPPGVFIPVAEECELIVPIGNWVIDRVGADLARWPRSKGRPPFVTVNLAARHLEHDGLVPTIEAALARNDLPARALGFEITESVRIHDLDAARANLRALARLGCRLAIDDFGIGHATLDYLRRFSMADVIKIDRSFVDGLGDSPEDTAIVSASVALAQSLDMQVIAEGVETETQYAILRDMGCRFAQGHLIDRAIPHDEVLERWAKGRLIDAEAIPAVKQRTDPGVAGPIPILDLPITRLSSQPVPVAAGTTTPPVVGEPAPTARLSSPPPIRVDPGHDPEVTRTRRPPRPRPRPEPPVLRAFRPGPADGPSSSDAAGEDQTQPEGGPTP